MSFDINSIESVLGLLLGGGGFGALLTWKFTRRKLNAEASSSEVDLAQKVQETYQDMLEYKQKEVEDNHRLIEELRADRDHYKQGYDEMRDRQDKTEEKIRELEEKVSENKNAMNAMVPFLCGVQGCPKRKYVEMFNDATKSKRQTKKQAK